ncbi:MAG TPA: HD domain-containing protein [Nannocystaceae bacterium]|nr:HD domain-containing protein [Nannocystaceae bacterium]
MTLWSPDVWHRAFELAARAHHGQKLPGTEQPYVLHPCAVAMELSLALAQRDDIAQPDLAIACALLHDVVEDTAVGVDEIRNELGDAVAQGVLALSKDPAVGDKSAQMRDSLRRIKLQPPEVWMVKLADRIHNLREPPHYWSPEKISRYRDEAGLILAELGPACPVLSQRLRERMTMYGH